MEDGHSGTDALEGLLAAYASWRASTLGRITDRLELDLMLEVIGPTSERRVLDVGCGDGVLAVERWKRGAAVTGLGASREMNTVARSRAGREAAEIEFAGGREPSRRCRSPRSASTSPRRLPSSASSTTPRRCARFARSGGSFGRVAGW